MATEYTTGGTKTPEGIVQFDPNTGKPLAPGATIAVAPGGNTYGASSSAVEPLDYPTLAKKYGITNYTGTPAQIAAVDAYYGGYKGSKSSGISGSSKIGINTNLGSATKSATKSLLNSQGVTQTGSTTGSTGGTSSTSTSSQITPTAPPPLTEPSSDLNIATFQNTANNDIASAQASTQAQLQPLLTQYTDQYGQIQTQKSQALAAATANFLQTHPYSSDEDMQSFLNGISQPYDTQLQDMTDSYNGEVSGINASANAQIQGIKDTYTSNVLSYNQQNIANAKAAKASVLQYLEFGNIDPSNPPQAILDTLTSPPSEGGAGMSLDDAKSFLQTPSYKSVTEQIDWAKLGISKQEAVDKATQLGISQDTLNLAVEKYENGTATSTDTSVLQQLGILPATLKTTGPGSASGTSPTSPTVGSSDYQNYLNAIGQ